MGGGGGGEVGVGGGCLAKEGNNVSLDLISIVKYLFLEKCF